MELTIIQAIFLGFVQGFTEFLPVSSSGHLALMPFLFDFDDPGLAFSAALHLGTLLAVVIYFRRDLVEIIRSAMGYTVDGSQLPQRMLLLLAIATIPAIIVGFFFEEIIETFLRTPMIIASLLVIGSFFFYLTDRFTKKEKPMKEITLTQSIIFGLLQAIAVIPGVSRSGMTIAAGRMLGFSRDASTRFSFLMAIPVILGASILELPDVIDHGLTITFLIGAIVSFATAYITIKYFLLFIQKIPFSIFVWYSIFLAGVIIYFVY